MKCFAGFTELIKFLTVVACLVGPRALAQIAGPSAQEVKYSYTTTFEIPADAEQKTDEDRVQFHATHIFGLFHSPTLVKRLGLPEGIGGIGAPRSQMKIKVISSEVDGDLLRIKYSNSGKMILHSKAAAKLLLKGVLQIPMPLNPYEIYDEKCTDDHYNSFGDYWYFYDPFKKDCEYLSKSPKAVKVDIAIEATVYKKLQTKAQLPVLRGDNGNGNLFSVYVIHGFESDPKDRADAGRSNFKEFNEYMNKNAFTEDKLKSNASASLYVYTKDITLDNEKVIHVEVKHLLVTTSVSSKSKVFALFYKEAVENADVIVYGGHSGLGGNLDIPSLEAKAGAFQFNSKKKQIFFFDSCSSYSYYLEHFAVEKTKAKIDVISYGLSSYFHTSNGVLAALMDNLLATDSKDKLWADILHDMESTLEGDTYLLNVGGL